MGEQGNYESTRGRSQEHSLRARPYPALVPAGAYLAACFKAFGPHMSRSYGPKIYLTFALLDDAYAGIGLPMFFRPSHFPTSRYYRSWVVANGRPPSRNARLSPRVFVNKVFRVLVETVKPRIQITGENGKQRPGPEYPATHHYSKVSALLSLEVTSDPQIVTEILRNSSPHTQIDGGEVGSRELVVGSKREARGGPLPTSSGNPPGEAASAPLPGATPQHGEQDKYAKRRALIKQQEKEIAARKSLREGGLHSPGIPNP